MTDWIKSTTCNLGNCVEIKFVKSSFCSLGDCVEVMYGETSVVVRDSKKPTGGHLIFTNQEWADFIEGVKNGEFDVPEATT